MARLDPTGVSRILSYIKTWVTTALGGKANSSHNHTKSQITDFPTIPSSTSQLTNDSGFLTSHQDLSGYVPKSGGAVMTGNRISRVDNTYELCMDGGRSFGDGATLTLFGKNTPNSGNEGAFWLTAYNTNEGTLRGTPDGSLSWGGGVFDVGGQLHFEIPANLRIGANGSGDHYISLNWGGAYYSTAHQFYPAEHNTYTLGASGSWWHTFYSNIVYTNQIECNVPAESFYTPLVGQMAANDNYRIRAGGTNNGGELWIETADDGNEPIGFAQYTGTFASVTRSGYLLNSSGNTEFPGTLFTYNGAVIHRNGIPTPGWGMDANTQSVLQIRTTDNTEPSICLHRSGYSHIVLAEQGGQFGVHAQGGTFDRCNTESNTVLNGYRIYVG